MQVFRYLFAFFFLFFVRFKHINMKKVIVIIPFLVIAANIFGQDTEKINKLTRLLKTNIEDTTRVHTLNKLAEEYCTFDTVLTKKYISESLVISQKIEYDYGRAEAIKILGVMYVHTSNYPKAIKNYKDSESIFREIDNPLGIADCLLNIGDAYTTAGLHEIGNGYTQKAFAIYSKNNATVKQAYCYNNFGMYYIMTGNLEESLKNLQKAAEIFKKYGTIEEQYSPLDNIGVVHLYLGNSKKASDYFKEAYNTVKPIATPKHLSHYYNNEASAYSVLGKNDSAIVLLKKAVKIDTEIDSKNDLATDLKNLGDLFLEIKENDSAFLYFNKAQSIAITIENKRTEISVLNSISNYYKSINNVEKAIEYCLSAIDLSTISQNNEELLGALSNAADLYLLRKDYENAYKNTYRFLNLNDSLKNQKTLSHIALFEEEFQSNEKDATISELKLDNFEKESQLKNTAIIVTFFIFAVGLLTYIYKRRSSKRFMKKIEEIRAKNFDKFHPLGNTLVAISQQINELPAEVLASKLNELGTEARRFAHLQFLPDFEKTTAHQEIEALVIEFRPYFKEKLAYLNSITDEKWKSLSTELQTLVYISVQELILNAIKHAEASLVKININIRKRKITLNYQDNGKGASDLNSADAGRGLSRIKDLVEHLNGTVSIQTAPQYGYACDIEIPEKRFFSLF